MRWTELDKKTLLVALERHGPNNLEEIQKYLPDISVTEIRSAIQKYKQMAQAKNHLPVNNGDETPLDQWLKVMKGLNSNSNDIDLYPRIFKYIALFEEHSEGSEVNFRDCYHAISEHMKGESVKTMDPQTSYFLSKCLSVLAHRVEDSDKTEMLNFVKSLENFKDLAQTVVRSYSKKKEEFPNNPLRIPPALLKMPRDSERPSTSCPQSQTDEDEENAT